MRREEHVPVIMDGLYAGSMDDAAWRRALIGMTDMVGGASYHLFALDPRSGAILHDESERVDPDMTRSYRDFWSLQDPRTSAALAIGEATGMFDGMIMPLGAWRRSGIYNDFLAVHGIPYFIAYWVHKSPEKLVAFSVQATEQRGPFDERDDALLRPLMPHLKRVLDIRDRLAMQAVRADALASSLDRLQHALFVLDDCARIVEMNGIAEDLLRTEQVLRREPDNTLWLSGDAGLELLRRVFSGAPPTDRDTTLLQRAGRPPLSVLIVPLPEVMSWSGSRPRWLLLMFDQEQRQRASARSLALALNVTEREAELVALLSRHCDLAQAAIQLGISLHTARSHLKSIYAKTGVRSRAELVGRALSGWPFVPGIGRNS